MMSLLDTDSSSFPRWVNPAIDLLAPVLKVMARPVVVNTLGRTAADPSHPTPRELEIFLEKVAVGIRTFGTRASTDRLVDALRRLVLTA